jgi:hypothetical protein
MYVARKCIQIRRHRNSVLTPHDFLQGVDQDYKFQI